MACNMLLSFIQNLEPMNRDGKGLTSYLVSISILMIVTPIFMESFGPNLFYADSHNAFEDESRMIYFLSTICGQISFSLVSRIDGGFIILPMFEAFATTSDISKKCLESCPHSLKNTLLCLFVSCVMSCVLGALLCATGTVKFLMRIPRNITDSIMIMAGALNLWMGLSKVVISGAWMRSSLLVAASVIVTVGALRIFGRTKNPLHLLLYLIALILGMNSLRLYFSGDELVDNRIFLCRESRPLSIRAVLDVFLSRNPNETANSLIHGLDFLMVVKNIFSIITISILPLVSMAISLSIYSKAFGSKVSIRREVYSLSFSNLISSLSFYPNYFNCTGSIFFRMCGASTRLHSLLGGISLIVLYFCMHRIIPLIPVFAVSLLLQFIGFSVLTKYLETLNKATFLDKLLVVALCTFYCIVRMNVLFTTLFGLSVNFLVSFFFTRKIFNGTGIRSQEIDGVVYAKIGNRLDANNISLLTDILDSTPNDVVVDLFGCRYVDYSANCELEEYCSHGGRSITVLGNPRNLNRKLL